MDGTSRPAPVTTTCDRLPAFATPIHQRPTHTGEPAPAPTLAHGRNAVPLADPVLDEPARVVEDHQVSKNDSRLVYSTASAGKCPGCGWPQRDCQCSSRHAPNTPIPTRIVVKLRVEKKGRGGKTVTVVDNLPANVQFLRDLCQELKRACGTGGTTVETGVELQGDHRELLRDLLAKRGWVIKG